MLLEVMTLLPTIFFEMLFSGGTERKSLKSGNFGSVRVPGVPSPLISTESVSASPTFRFVRSKSALKL